MNRYARRPLWPILLLLLPLCAWLLFPANRPALAQPRRNIVLLYFTAAGQDNAVLLEWATASEFNTAGFLMERALSADGPYAVLDGIGFIPSEGSGIVGAEYEATDTTATNGTTYWYRLIEVELDGDENREGPVSATPGAVQPTATYTPTPSQTPPPSATPSPTQTSGVVNTPIPPGDNQQPTATNAATQPANTPTTQPDPPTVTPLAISTAPPTTTPGSGGQDNITPTPSAPPAGSIASNNPALTPEPSGPAPNQVEPTATNSSGYPGQPDAAATPTSEATAYPGIEPTPLGAAPEATTYPGGAGDDLLDEINSPAVIGGEGSPAATEAANATNQQTESGGTVFLWVAFVAALFIFIAGVLGSIFLFNRQRVRGG